VGLVAKLVPQWARRAEGGAGLVLLLLLLLLAQLTVLPRRAQLVALRAAQHCCGAVAANRHSARARATCAAAIPIR
jgi:hypothetical protein